MILIYEINEYRFDVAELFVVSDRVRFKGR